MDIWFRAVVVYDQAVAAAEDKSEALDPDLQANYETANRELKEFFKL
jgi:hypothetical protein